MRIAVAADHGGFLLKEGVRNELTKKGHDVHDFGTSSDDSVDYPPLVSAAARAVSTGEYELGIVFCGSGVGASIVANKVRGVRCALCYEPYGAELARRHNDANTLALGGRLTGLDMALRIVEVFLSTPFDGGRHARRIRQIAELEQAENGLTAP
jgi:ribose 5-phosphate isomerase B